MLKIFRLVFILIVFLCAETSAGKIDVVTVVGTAFGANEGDAIKNAVFQGIAQVNGEQISSTTRVQSSTQSASGKQTQASRSIEKEIEQSTKGVVKSWKKLSVTGANHSFTATVEVQVYVQEKSEQLKRIKLAIVSKDHATDEMTEVVIRGLTRNLTSSRKFAIIDRNNDAAISREIESIKNQGNIEDQVRVNTAIAPDYIVVVAVTPYKSKLDSYQIESDFEIIDYSTRQIKFSEKKSIKTNASDDETVKKRLDILSKNMSRAIIEILYPPLVVGFNIEENTITVSQGLDFFSVGDKCTLKEVKKAITDPYTKEFLSYEKSDIGSAEIIYSDKRISVAKLSSKIDLNTEKLSAKKYEIWRNGQSPRDLFKEFERPIRSSTQSSEKNTEPDY